MYSFHSLNFFFSCIYLLGFTIIALSITPFSSNRAKFSKLNFQLEKKVGIDEMLMWYSEVLASYYLISWKKK